MQKKRSEGNEGNCIEEMLKKKSNSPLKKTEIKAMAKKVVKHFNMSSNPRNFRMRASQNGAQNLNS